MKKPSSFLLAAICLSMLAGCETKEDPSFHTAVAELGAVESRVEDSGTVVYQDPYAVIPSVNGRIVSCGFEEGDRVAAGQTLYVIDSTALEDQITQARLTLESAALAYEQSVTACADLNVLSRISGMVTARYCHVGDYVTVGSRILDVVDSANLTLTVPFSPADAVAITPGSPAGITFPTYTGSVSGVVEQVFETSTVLDGAREGVYVKIAFLNPGALTSGTAAVATVGTAACMEAGTVAYATEQSVFATQSGTVSTLPFDVGHLISAGDTVMTLENQSLTNAAANASLARQTAATALAQLEDKRADYVIMAPADGTVITRSAKEGDHTAAAAPMATLVPDGSLCVETDIDELFIQRIRPGQEAAVTFTSERGETRTYAAAVRRVDEAGVTSGGVTDYTVELTLEDTEGLKAGMNVSVSILTGRKSGCVRIPTAALNGSAVSLFQDGERKEVTVVPGLSGGGYTEILEGVEEGDTVILGS